jgi:hypothetical protein
MNKTASVKKIAPKVTYIENESKPVLFGKLKGITFKELFEKHGDYARWYHNTTN